MSDDNNNNTTNARKRHQFFAAILLLAVCTNQINCLPELKSAMFLDNFEEISLRFNETISQTTAIADCKSVLHVNTTLPKMGKNPTCEISTFSIMTVVPGLGATIMDGDTIQMNTMYFANVDQVLSPDPSTKVPPSINIQGSQEKQCLCTQGDLHFNVDTSYNLAYKGLSNITWSIRTELAPVLPPIVLPSSSSSNVLTTSTSVTASSSQSSVAAPSSTSVTTSSSQSSLNASSASVSNSNSSDVVTPSMTSSVTSQAATSAASVSITPQRSTSTAVPSTSSSIAPPTTPPPAPNFTDILSPQQGKTEIKLPYTKFSNRFLYTIHVEGINAFGMPSNTHKNISFLEFTCQPSVRLEQVASDRVHFEALIDYPPCWLKNRSPTFTWGVTQNGVQSKIGVSTVHTQQNIYMAERNQFSKNLQYIIKVTVKTKNAMGLEVNLEESKQFSVGSKPLQCRILGGEVVVGLDGTLMLDARTSFDPEESTDAETFTWSCRDENGADCQKNGANVLFDSGKFVRFAMSDGDFQSNLRYEFKLTYSKGSRSAMCKVGVTAKQGSSNQLTVYAQTNNDRQNVWLSSPVTFVARLNGVLTGSFPFSWTCYDKYEIAKSNLIPGNVKKSGSYTVLVGKTLHSMVLSVVTLPAHLFSRKFQLVCECLQNGFTSGYTVKYIGKIRTPSLSIFPNSGKSYDTQFRLHLDGWYAGFQNKALSFRFSYTPDYNKIPKQFLTGWTSSNAISGVRFPMLAGGSSSTLKLFVDVRNEDYTYQQVEGEVTVNKVVAADIDRLLSTSKNDSVDFTNFDLIQSTSLLMNFALLSPNFDTLSMNSSLPTDDVQSLFMKLIDLFILLPLTPESSHGVIEAVRYFVGKADGRVNPVLREKVKEMFLHLSTSLRDAKGDTNYITQTTSVVGIFDTLLKKSGNLGALLACIEDIAMAYTSKLIENVVSPFSQPSLISNDDGYSTPDNPLLNLKITHQRFLTNSPSTSLVLMENITSQYTSWKCDGDLSYHCNGIIVVELQYNQSLFADVAPDTITDVYNIDVLSPLNGDVIDIPGIWYNFTLPIKDDAVKMDDPILCFMMVNDGTQGFRSDFCNSTTVFNTGEVMCRCNRTGYVIGALDRSLMPIITTESPFPGESVNRSMYFYTDAERCTDQRLWGFFKPKFKKQLAEALDVKPQRIKISGCTPGSIIVHFYILDVVGERRNVHVARDLDALIFRETFKVIMNNGDDIWMYDLNQTTPKPPPPTIPPIGEVTVDWLPIGIAIGVLAILFIMCIVAVYFFQTRLLRKNILTKFNSDRKEPPEEQEEEHLSRKQELQRSKQITDEDLDCHDAGESAIIDEQHGTVNYTKKGGKKRNAIQPINNSGALNVVGFPRVPANVNDEPARLAMDDSSDEEDRVQEKKEKRKRLFQAKTTALISFLRIMNKTPENSLEPTAPTLEPVQTLQGDRDEEGNSAEGEDGATPENQ